MKKKVYRERHNTTIADNNIFVETEAKEDVEIVKEPLKKRIKKVAKKKTKKKSDK